MAKLKSETYPHDEESCNRTNRLPNFVHWAIFGCVGLAKRINHVGDFDKAFVQNVSLFLELFQKTLDIVHRTFSLGTLDGLL